MLGFRDIFPLELRTWDHHRMAQFERPPFRPAFER